MLRSQSIHREHSALEDDGWSRSTYRDHPAETGPGAGIRGGRSRRRPAGTPAPRCRRCSSRCRGRSWAHAGPLRAPAGRPANSGIRSGGEAVDSAAHGTGVESPSRSRISVSGLHVSQRPAEPVPRLHQMRRVRTDRDISQPGRRPGQNEPGQHIRFERRRLIRPGRRTHITQIPHDRQAQPGLLAFTDPARSILKTLPSENPNSLQKTAPARPEEQPPGPGANGLLTRTITAREHRE